MQYNHSMKYLIKLNLFNKMNSHRCRPSEIWGWCTELSEDSMHVQTCHPISKDVQISILRAIKCHRSQGDTITVNLPVTAVEQ